MNTQLRSVSPLLVIWRTEGVFLKAPNYSVFSFFSHILIVIPLGSIRGVCVSVCCVQACAHTCMCACVHVWAIWFFPLYACEADVKACAFSLPSLLCSAQQGLSRARIKGAQEEEKVLPQLIWPLWGEEHYSHWCSGRMVETPRSFRKGAYSRLDVTRRTGLEDGCWAHCGDGGNIVPAPLL